MASKRKILAMHRFRFEDQRERLERNFEVIGVKNPEDAQKIIDENQDIVAIASIIGRPVSANLIQALPNLEVISNFGVGTDHIDLEMARKREIVVTNTPDVVTRDTADAAMAYILNTARRFVEGDIFVRVGKWLQGGKPVGTVLWGKTVGIVGLGRIGKAVAKRAEAFDMDVAYTAGSGIKKDVSYTYYDDVKKLANACDFLVITCPATPETHHMIDKEVLQILGPNGFLINVARGSIVHTEDLIWALQNRVIAGAGLDVFENEPFVPEAFLSMDNVVLGPHMANSTEETQYLQGEMVMDNLDAYFKGESLLSKVV